MIKLSEERAQRAIALILRYGSRISTVVMALGLGLSLVRLPMPLPAADEGLHAEALFTKLIHFDPLAVTGVGILLLLLTPVFRIVVAAASFALERDFKYFLISLGVLAVVLLSVSYAVG